MENLRIYFVNGTTHDIQSRDLKPLYQALAKGMEDQTEVAYLAAPGTNLCVRPMQIAAVLYRYE